MGDEVPAGEPRATTRTALVVMITGAGPGLGKSTLAAALCATVAKVLPGAELFKEEDILDHPCFTTVITEFRARGQASPGTLVLDARRYLADLASRQVPAVVLDALFPYLTSLLAWGHDDPTIESVFANLGAALEPFRGVHLHLTGDVAAGLARAATREGGDWLDRAIEKTNAYPATTTVATVDDLIAYLEHTASRQSALLARAPWPVTVLDADAGRDAVLEAATRAAAAATTTAAPGPGGRGPTERSGGQRPPA